MKGNNLTQGTEWKAILTFALPIMVSQLLQQLYSTVDGIIVGNFVSSAALGAMGSCMSFVMLFVALAIGMSNGCGIVVSQFYGAGRREDMRRAASTILIVLFTMGAVLMVVSFFTARSASYYVLGVTDEQLLAYSVEYISIYSLGFIFQFVYNAVSAILRSVGDSKAVLYFLLVATVINVVLDLLFVAVLPWGVAGAAAATVIAQFFCVLASILYMYKNYPDFRFGLRELRFHRDKFKLCMRMGIPSTIQFMVISFGHLFLQRLINTFGSATMAACTVGSRYDHYASIPIMANLQAMAAFAGQNTGAGRYDRVKRGLVSVLIINVIMVSILCAGLYTFASPLARLFGVEGEALKQSVEYLRYISYVYILFALYIPVSALFQGCGDPMASTICSLIALSIRVGMGYFMVYVLDWGYNACWENLGIGWAASLIYVIIHYFRGTWKTKSLVKNMPSEA